MRETDRSRAGVKAYTGINVECFLYMNADNKPCAVGYSGKKNKPNFRYRFRTIAEAVFKINDFIMAAEIKSESDRLRKIEDTKMKKELFDKVVIGSIFVLSWGYDQTNVDAYQVIEKKGTATLVLREIGLKTVESTGDMSCNVIPVKDSFLPDEKPFEKRVNRFGIRMNSYSSASLWDGKSDYYRSWYA
jgi:hypothetical protein